MISANINLAIKQPTMKYKVTKQYARDVETPLAEFCEYDDASFFIERKLLSDEEKNLKLIYRAFDNYKLLKEFNKEKITSPINTAQYAEGDSYLPNSLGPFKVSKDDPAANALAAFTDLNDAELFVEDKLTHTTAITTYYIFNNDVLITEMNQRIKRQTQSEQGSQGKAQAASFKPTPLATSPRPSGMPATWFKDEDEDKK